MQRRDLLLASAALAAVPRTWAQTGRPIRLIVPYAPGGPLDVTARALAERVRESLGTVVVENKPGAGGNLGADLVAKAAPDGHTIGLAAVATHAINPWLFSKMPYDATRDFAPITQMVRVPNVLVMNAETAQRLKINTLADLIAYAKAHPAQLNYGSGGNGSAAHTATEYLKLVTQSFMVHVPYRGTAPAVTDVVANQIQVIFSGAPAVMPMVKAGKLKALAVSSPKRIDGLSEIPTVAESGVPGTAGFEADQWYGIVAPAGTPAAIVTKLNAQINASLNSPEVLARLRSEGAVPTPNPPEVFGKLIASEIPRWKPVVQRAGIKPD